MGYYKPIDTRTAEQKEEAAFKKVLGNVQGKYPDFSPELCRTIAWRIVRRQNSAAP
jgi:hypothetical protein